MFIKIGKIDKIFRKNKLILFGWVYTKLDLKTQFFSLFETINKREMIKVGKSYDEITKSYLRLVIYKWSLYTHWKDKNMIWIGVGRFEEGKEL